MLCGMAEKLTPERRREMTRQALIDAAAELFATKGFNGASMEEIAAEAGFTRGAIYSNFGSKDELLIAVMDRFNERMVEEYRDVAIDDPVATAEAAGKVFQRELSLDMMPLELELRLNALRNPEVRKILAEADRRASENVGRFIEEQFIASGIKFKLPARDVGDIGRAAVIGLLELAAVAEGKEAERYENLVELFFLSLATGLMETDEPPATSDD
jgi:AcrR family transcriptional regulator